jgi:hypothetical protein
VANLGGKYGATTITGTLSGKTMSGTWKSASGNGKITITGPDKEAPTEPCKIHWTFTVENPTGQSGGTENSTIASSGGGGGGAGAGGGGGGTGATGGGERPWDSGDAQGCFEKWIALATRLINAADLGSENLSKPWSFSKYGTMTGGKSVYSSGGPDDWERHGRNKYWEMWDLYNTDPDGIWTGNNAGRLLRIAKVPPLRDYIRKCAPPSAVKPLPSGMALIAPDVRAAKGTQVFVPIRIQNARDVLNMDFELSYTPDVVTARADAERGSVVAQASASKLVRPGLFKFNFAQMSAVNGEGTVAGFRFDATGPARSRTPLTLTVHTVNDSKGAKLPISTVDGSIVIYDPNDPTDVNNPSYKDPTGGAGTMQPTCSGTGKQTALDAQCCLEIWVELKGPKEAYMQMDVNGDGVVDSADAIRILQNVAGGLAK